MSHTIDNRHVNQSVHHVNPTGPITKGLIPARLQLAGNFKHLPFNDFCCHKTLLRVEVCRGLVDQIHISWLEKKEKKRTTSTRVNKTLKN